MFHVILPKKSMWIVQSENNCRTKFFLLYAKKQCELIVKKNYVKLFTKLLAIFLEIKAFFLFLLIPICKSQVSVLLIDTNTIVSEQQMCYSTVFYPFLSLQRIGNYLKHCTVICLSLRRTQICSIGAKQDSVI